MERLALIQSRWVEPRSTCVCLWLQSTMRTGRLGENSDFCPILTANTQRSAPHRFAGRCDPPSRSQRRPENTRTECPHRISWLTGCRVFRTEPPPPRYLASTRDARTLRKLKRELVSPSQPSTLSQ